MTETNGVQSLVPETLAPPKGATIALIEIWRRPDVGFPSVFCRSVRARPSVWVPELHERIVHKSGAKCTITGIREVTDAPPVFNVTWDDPMQDDTGELVRLRADFEADEFRERFVPVRAPVLKFDYSEWEPIDAAFAKRALRLRRYTLVEFPGVEWAARRFESDRATQRDYDRVLELREAARAAKRS
jgi:hypothetical protein